MLVRVPGPVVDVRFVAAVNQGEEDAACGAAEVEEEFGEAFAQALQRYVERGSSSSVRCIVSRNSSSLLLK